jgi:UDP-glucose 4-epimerase
MKKPSLLGRVRNRFPVKNIVDRLPLDYLTMDQEELTLKFSTNRKFLQLMLGFVRLSIKVLSRPGIRDVHPWVSDKHTHGVTLPINEELKYDNMLLPYPIISEFIDKSSHRMIMNVCGCRQAYDCQNHSPELGCLNLGESVLDMAPGLGRLVTKEEAHAHAQKAIESGLVPSVGKGRIDNFFYGIPDKGKLMGVCFCCHCCCIAGSFKELPAEQLDRMFPRIEGLRMEVTDDCIGCGSCTEYCIYDAISIDSGKAVLGDLCRQCGRCATQCPSKAISISLDNHDFMEEMIQRISSYVDVT